MTIAGDLRVPRYRSAGRRVPGWVIVGVVAFVLSVPALSVGLFYDDVIHRVVLADAWPHYHREPWSLYEFMRGGDENAVLRRVGLLPWFSEPDVAIRFFRPLSSLLVALDYALFGDAALPPHLHSLLWFGAVVVLVWKIHRALLPEREAFFSSLVFAAAGAHAETLAWAASRHVFVAGALGLGAWYVCIRAHELRRPWLVLGSHALLIAGFCASEATLCVVPFILGYQWFAPGQTSRQRVVHASPTVLCTLVYLAFYSAAGYGTLHVGGYVSPFDSPSRFAMALVERVPVSLTQLFTAIPAITSYVSPAAKVVMWALGPLSALLVFFAATRRASRMEGRAACLRWIPWAALAALAPTASMLILAGRALLLPLVGASMMVGVLLGGLTARGSERESGGFWFRAGAVVLAILHLGVSPLTRVTIASSFGDLSRMEGDLPARSRLMCQKDSGVFVINAHAPGISMYSGPTFYRAGQRERPFWHVLTMAPNDLELERVTTNSFTLTVVEPRGRNLFEQLYRPSFKQLEPGDRIPGENLTVTVLAADENGPKRMLFELPTALDAPENCFVRWVSAERRLESVTLPKAAPLRIPYVRAPYEL